MGGLGGAGRSGSVAGRQAGGAAAAAGMRYRERAR